MKVSMLVRRLVKHISVATLIPILPPKIRLRRFDYLFLLNQRLIPIQARVNSNNWLVMRSEMDLTTSLFCLF